MSLILGVQINKTNCVTSCSCDHTVMAVASPDDLYQVLLVKVLLVRVMEVKVKVHVVTVCCTALENDAGRSGRSQVTWPFLAMLHCLKT